MPSRRSTTTTAEPATEAPSANGTGSRDLEELPDFTLPPGVRPSERCGTPAPPGAHFGARCEFKDEHTGRHSWQPAEAADVNSDVEQGELPGTLAEADDLEPTEPEPTDYDVPLEASFGKRDLLEAPGIRTIAERLIREEESFDHLQGIEIRCFWRRRGGTQGGNPRYGRIKRPSVYESHFTGGQTVYFLELAADHIRDARFTPTQIDAAIFRELCKTDVDPDDHDAYRLVGPDFVGFIREIEVFGAWSADLREAAARIQQLPLVDVAEHSDGADKGEGEE